MADTKISSLTELTSLADADEFVVVDKSDTAMAGSGSDKRVKWGTIQAAGVERLERYVDYVNGDDTNPGLTVSSAMKTIQAAYDDLVTASAAYGSDTNGRRGVGRILLAPGDHQVGEGLDFDARYQVDLVGIRSGRTNHDMSASASRIVSTSTTATEFVRVVHSGSIGLGFVFREIAFRVDEAVNTSLTKVIWVTAVGRLRVERCSFGTAGNVDNLSVTAIYHEDHPNAGDVVNPGEAGWVRIVANDCSRMQLYKSQTTTGAGGNYNRGRIQDNVILYGDLPGGAYFGPMIHINASTNGLLVDGNNLEGKANGIQIGPNGVFTQNTFLNNSGEDPSPGTPPNPFYWVSGGCSAQIFMGGVCTAPQASGAGTWIHFDHDNAYNNLVIGPFDATGVTMQKRKVIDDSTTNGNVLLHTNHRLATKYETGAGAAISDADFTTGPPPNGSLGLVYDSSASRVSLFARSNGAWSRFDPTTVTTKGDLATFSTVPTRLAVGATNGHVLTVDDSMATGLKWAASSPAGGQTLVTRTADSTHVNSGTTGTTLTNDDTLLWAVAGNSTEVWFFESFFIFNTANATMDIKMGWTVPSGTTMDWGLGYVAGATFPGFYALAVGTAPQGLYTAASSVSIGSPVGKAFVGPSGFVYSGGTAGNVNFKWAQDTANASDIYLVKNSFLRLTKLVA